MYLICLSWCASGAWFLLQKREEKEKLLRANEEVTRNLKAALREQEGLIEQLKAEVEQMRKNRVNEE